MFIQRPTNKFHVVVGQVRQRNVPKSVPHVQNCCFGYQTFCFFDVYVAVAVAVAVAVVVAKAPFFFA